MTLNLNDLSNTQVLDYLLKLKDDIVMLFTNYDIELKKKNYHIIANLELIPDNKYIELYNELVKIPTLWENIGYINLTLLQQICYRGDPFFIPFIEKLIQHADLWMIPSITGNNSLHLLIYAFRNHHKIEFQDVILKLTLYYVLWLKKNNNGSTPLHELCLFRNDIIINIAEHLTIYPALWEMYDGNKMTPLHYLCSHNVNIDKKKYVSLFSKLSKHIHLWKNKDDFGYTPLHVFCRNFTENEFHEIYNKFNEYPELWTIQTKNGLTPKDIMLSNQ